MSFVSIFKKVGIWVGSLKALNCWLKNKIEILKVGIKYWQNLTVWLKKKVTQVLRILLTKSRFHHASTEFIITEFKTPTTGWLPCFCVSDFLSLFLGVLRKNKKVYFYFLKKRKKTQKSVVFVIKIEKDDNSGDRQSRIFGKNWFKKNSVI